MLRSMATTLFVVMAAGCNDWPLDVRADTPNFGVPSDPVAPDQLPTTSALVVDTFAVWEYTAACGSACPYVVYAPVLKLREPTGWMSAFVEAVEYSIPTMTTGWSPMNLELCAGISAHMNGIDPYLWNNDHIFVSDTRIQGTARARVIVRDPTGRRGLIDVTAPIRPLGNPDELPPPLPPNGRVC